MVQCGLLVPMVESSEAGIFRDILIDIGDEQSIENDLSTYSSHLLNMKNFFLVSSRLSHMGILFILMANKDIKCLKKDIVGLQII